MVSIKCEFFNVVGLQVRLRFFISKQLFIFVRNLTSMCCTEYGSITLYVADQQTVVDKIAALDKIEMQLLNSMLDASMGAPVNTSMYELDDGQVRIKVAYRSVMEIENALNGIQRTKNYYINQLNGRTVVLRDRSTYRGGYRRC